MGQFSKFCDHSAKICDHKKLSACGICNKGWFLPLLRHFGCCFDDALCISHKKTRPEGRVFKILFGVAYANEPSMAIHASIKPLTASTDLSNIACSSFDSLMFAIRSMPPAPITVGTPTYMSD